MQSELYLGARGGEADAAKVAADTPDLVVFNGYAQQYDHAPPLTARVGDRVRFWVLAAGPNRGTAFHVVGGQFDSVWAEGAYRLRPGGGGSQTLGAVPPLAGRLCRVELPRARQLPPSCRTRWSTPTGGAPMALSKSANDGQIGSPRGGRRPAYERAAPLARSARRAPVWVKCAARASA